MSIPLTSREILRQPLPDIVVGLNHTQSSAIHNIKYVGRLGSWTNFKQEVVETFETTNWSPQPILPNLSLGPLASEHILCGDETGLQGRFNERIGQVLGVVFEINHIDFVFGDFKSTTDALTYRKTPDVMIMRHDGNSHVVGEIKAFWVPEHQLEVMVSRFNLGREKQLRRILGQVTQYMENLDLKHAFLSNYRETLFLRQALFGRSKGIEISPVIHHDDVYTTQGGITLRQAMVHMARCSLANRRLDAGLRGVWTVNT